MRKTLAAGLAAVTFGGAVATAALPSVADAQGFRGGHGGFGHGGGFGRGGFGHGGFGHDHGHHNDGAAIFAGVAGLALGAALASPSYGYGYGYPNYGYGYAPYYGSGYYGYGYAPYACASRHWVWDPYLGRQILVTSYAC